MGQGKDSIVLRVKKNETLYIFKSLSEHALKYLSIMKSINKVNSRFLVKIEIIDDKFYLCKNLNTYSPNTSPEKCLECIKILCDLQIDLLSNDFLMWDYGTKQPNYLSTDDGLKIVDYGGGGFINIKNTKYNKKFVQYSLLLHFMLIGLGKTEVEKLIVIIKNFEFSKNHDELIFSLFRGTYFENLCKETLAIDFLKSMDG